MVPGAAGEVLVDVEVAMSKHVEAGALLVADGDGHGVLEFFAEADVEHAGIERLAPHADVEPAGAGEGTGGSAGKNKVGGSGEHERIVSSPQGRPGGPTQTMSTMRLTLPILFGLAFCLQAADITVGTATARPGLRANGVIAVAAGVDAAANIPVIVINGARPGP